MLNPQWLRTFTAVADLGSFTRASERLGLTQAAVSQHVRALEDELGPLLIRRPRQLELTPAGTAFLAYCAEVGQADQRLRARLSDADEDCGEITVVTPGSVGLALYPRLLDLQLRNPGLVIRHRFAPDAEIVTAVLERKYELGLVTLRPDDPRLASEHYTEEALEMVVPAGVKINDWRDLQALGYIDHPDGQAMATRLLSRHFPGNPGIGSLPVKGYTNQVGLILEPVARGMGFTVLPQYARMVFRHQAKISVVDCRAPVVDTLWWIWRGEWPLSARARRLIHTLCDRAARGARGDGPHL